MNRIWTNAVGSVLLVIGLAGCATTKEELLSHDDATMLDIWNRNATGQTGNGQVSRQLLDARQAVRRPLTLEDMRSSQAQNDTYTRSARNEILSQFRRLPNPDLVMYVFPHLAGTEPVPVPVPGYSTVFPLYQRVQYAMPGERTENY